MRERKINLLELALIAVTRAMIGFGAGLLASRQLERKQRKTVGLALVGVGALSTLPLALRVFRSRADSRAQAAAMMAD